ncbi:phage tail sheath family protein [Aequorivita sp. H23M31]|uniref:Phage tail sheath family protein n=2 Tax=Aequorivita ciconiae TaxID=2494375 RepID=A0A410G7I7_9FLAO|nr:phage tail sheath family protein [Aequorivita sp. H23M31]
MDPLNAKFAPIYVSQNSSLVDVELAGTAPAATPGYSQSGRPLPKSKTPFQSAMTSAFAKGTSFRIISNGISANVDLEGIDLTGTVAGIITEMEGRINANLPLTSKIAIDKPDGPTNPAATLLLRIRCDSGDVFIEPASSNDIARSLMLGTAQGGLEVSRYSNSRPQANAMVLKISDLVTLENIAKDAFDTITIDSTSISLTGPYSINIGSDFIYQDNLDPLLSITGNNDGVREKFAIIVDAINNEMANNPLFRWNAQLWGSRLAIIPTEGGDNAIGTLTTGGVDIGGSFEKNVRYYSLGASGNGPFQADKIPGSDGSTPTLSDYTNTFPIIDQEVDIFNLMILPSDDGHTPETRASLWGPSSIFCQEKRAFLLMDPPTSWKDPQTATNPTTGVNSLRIGLVKDYSAIFFPRVTIKNNGLDRNIGPSGAIAGLMARIDGSRGVWKAPAGTEADIRGITGLEYRFSDRDNGILNPKAINTLRVFPNGIVNWGARTMDGDDDFASEYKYIPIRRTALYIEESLYRGLKWVVFEPNDEPLWAQIRLNVGAFMHNLFRQGAFQGTKKQDAYFVKCDNETTTQNDINLGIVNVWVGFAPLKPAEFVILYLQQMTGQIQV